MFPSAVSAGTVFTPGNGVGSVVCYWLSMVGVFVGVVLAFLAFFLFIVGNHTEQPEERKVLFKGFRVFLIAAIACYMASAVFDQYSLPSNSTVEGTVVKVMDTGSDGAELLFDDGKSVRMYKPVSELKVLQGIRVHLSCNSQKVTNDSFDDISECEYGGIIAVPSHTPSKSSGAARQERKPSWMN